MHMLPIAAYSSRSHLSVSCSAHTMMTAPSSGVSLPKTAAASSAAAATPRKTFCDRAAAYSVPSAPPPPAGRWVAGTSHQISGSLQLDMKWHAHAKQVKSQDWSCAQKRFRHLWPCHWWHVAQQGCWSWLQLDQQGNDQAKIMMLSVWPLPVFCGLSSCCCWRLRRALWALSSSRCAWGLPATAARVRVAVRTCSSGWLAPVQC